jgi:hypothetical protein
VLAGGLTKSDLVYVEVSIPLRYFYNFQANTPMLIVETNMTANSGGNSAHHIFHPVPTHISPSLLVLKRSSKPLSPPHLKQFLSVNYRYPGSNEVPLRSTGAS